MSEKQPEAFGLDCDEEEIASSEPECRTEAFDPTSRSGMELLTEKRPEAFVLDCDVDELTPNEPD